MSDIVIVGEAWGEKEEETRLPFQGTSGWLLNQMLSQVGISRDDCFVTNVFNLRPKPSNDVMNLCGKKTDGIIGYPDLGKGKYVRAEFKPELDRLYREIKNERPNVIIALGATASWALLKTSGIKAIRGSIAQTHQSLDEVLDGPIKILPTYHPAAVSRQWNLRPIVLSDLDKALRNSTHREYTRPERHIWLEPTLEDLAIYSHKFIEPAELLSVDIETRDNQITCIGFAPDISSCIVIPFYTEEGKSYWPTLDQELEAWAYVRNWLLKPALFQNGLYDINFLWSKYGIPVPNAQEDTMLLHHAFQPEMEKGLGFLATIYTDEASWKFMRKGKKHD